jgi:hypothetical protein
VVFEKSKEKKAQRAADQAARAEEARIAAEEHERALRAWCIDVARRVAAGTVRVADAPIAVRKGENVLHVFMDFGLVEPRRGPGHWQGGSQAVSIRVPGTKSMRYRVGGTRGTYVQGDENPTIIDRGTFTITDQRAVFIGSKQSREWAWAKLSGFSDEDSANWTGIAVSNRQKVSGISYSSDDALATRWYLELAAAKANGSIEDMIAELDGPAHSELPASTEPTAVPESG